jgi:hypothetical protein
MNQAHLEDVRAEEVPEPELKRIFRRNGDPSWTILRVLARPRTALSGIEIIDQLQAAHPLSELDGSTTFFVLKRMKEDGLIRELPPRSVDVPVGHGQTRKAQKPVFVITGKGLTALQRHDGGAGRIPVASSVSMKAGPELDALVAEKMLGCAVGYSNGRPVCRCAGTWAHGQCGHWLKKYSSDMAAAWQVVEHMVAGGFQVKVATYTLESSLPEYRWECIVAHGAEPVAHVTAATAAEAICLAALRLSTWNLLRSRRQEHEVE